MRRSQFEIVVVGAGPAGIAAATSAARGGALVGVIDDNPGPGGQIWRGRPAVIDATYGRVRPSAGAITLLSRTRVVAPLGARALIAESAAETLEIHYEQLVLATGARELFVPFPGWTLPGVMGAGGLQALAKGGLPVAGQQIIVAGSGPLLLAVAVYLKQHGARVRLIAEQASWTGLAAFAGGLVRYPAKLVEAARLGVRLRGSSLRANCWVTRVHGTERIEAVTLRQGGRRWTEPCDYLACGFGLLPNVELAAALGCATREGAARVDEWQQTDVPGVFAAGEVTGVGGVELAVVEGEIAGLALTGQRQAARARFARRERARRFAAALERRFALRPELRRLPEDETIVCRCEDVSFGELARHTSWRGAKLHSRCGMGPCQGRVCGAATQFLFGWTQDTVRPPVTPARLESLAQDLAVVQREEELSL